MGHEPRVEGRDPDYWPDDASALADLASLADQVDQAQRAVDAEIRRMLGGDFDHLRYTNVLARYERAASNWKTVREALFLRAMCKWRAAKPAEVAP